MWQQVQIHLHLRISVFWCVGKYGDLRLVPTVSHCALSLKVRSKPPFVMVMKVSTARLRSRSVHFHDLKCDNTSRLRGCQNTDIAHSLDNILFHCSERSPGSCVCVCVCVHTPSASTVGAFSEHPSQHHILRAELQGSLWSSTLYKNSARSCAAQKASAYHGTGTFVLNIAAGGRGNRQQGHL